MIITWQSLYQNGEQYDAASFVSNGLTYPIPGAVLPSISDFLYSFIGTKHYDTQSGGSFFYKKVK